MTDACIDAVAKAADLLAERGRILAFTGAGASVESGIPPFRGPGGLWETVDPGFIEIDRFHREPKECWRRIKRVFYDFWGKAKPNPGHFALADLQKAGVVFSLVTQNIDGLYQRAGATDVVEFHGTMDRLECERCAFSAPVSKEILAPDVPSCPRCGAALKPAFVFYGEAIPEDALTRAFSDARSAGGVLVVGTTGEVMPACHVPVEAKRAGAVVVEANPDESAFTRSIVDCFIPGKAGEVLPLLRDEIMKRICP